MEIARCHKKRLDTIYTLYVMLLLDDYWLIDYVKTEKIKTLLGYVIKYKAGNLRALTYWCKINIFNEAESSCDPKVRHCNTTRLEKIAPVEFFNIYNLFDFSLSKFVVVNGIIFDYY